MEPGHKSLDCAKRPQYSERTHADSTRKKPGSDSNRRRTGKGIFLSSGRHTGGMSQTQESWSVVDAHDTSLET